MPERCRSLGVALSVRAHLPPLEVRSDVTEADRARTVPIWKGVERLAMREDDLEIVPARGRVLPCLQLFAQPLQQCAAAGRRRVGGLCVV